MLFHITARHDYVTCPCKDPPRPLIRGLIEGSSKVKIVGAWVDEPSHTIYAVVESDSAEATRNVCDGLIYIGPVEVRLVRDLVATLKAQ